MYEFTTIYLYIHGLLVISVAFHLLQIMLLGTFSSISCRGIHSCGVYTENWNCWIIDMPMSVLVDTQFFRASAPVCTPNG